VKDAQYSPVTLKFIRMTSGEDVITEYQTVTEEEGEYFLLQNPMKVLYLANPEKPNRISVSLMSWIFPSICADQSFVLHPNDVVTMGTPAKEIAEYYYQLTRGEMSGDREPTPEELEALEQEGFTPVSEDEVEQIRNFLRKTPAEKKKLLH
jgi:hypothetical protein